MELIDTAVLKSEFQEEIDNIHGRIDEEIANRQEVEQLWEQLMMKLLVKKLSTLGIEETKVRPGSTHQLWEGIKKLKRARS